MNRPSVLAVSKTTLDFGETETQLTFTVRNDGEETLDWSANPVEGWIGVSPASGSLEAGVEETVTVTVDRADQPAGDLRGGIDLTSNAGTARVTVEAAVAPEPTEGEVNQAPVLAAIGDQGVAEGGTLRIELSASDEDSDDLTYAVSGHPPGSSLSESTFAWDPTHEQAGAYEVTFTVSDGRGGTDSETVTITVEETNRAPVLAAVGDQGVAEGGSLQIELDGSDADEDDLTYSVSGHPSGSSLSESTFMWTPTHEQAGAYEVTFTVSDGRGGTDSETITITVEETNRAPVLAAVGDQGVAEGGALRIELDASDADEDDLTYSVSGHPSGSSLSESTFTWEPTHGQSGAYEVTFTVSDGRGGRDSETITITVDEADEEGVGDAEVVGEIEEETGDAEIVGEIEEDSGDAEIVGEVEE